MNFSKNLGRDREFEISAIELVNFKIAVICIYRSPHSDVKKFLENLEEIINKVSKKGIYLVMCGDWNINLLQENIHQKALLSLLLSNNLLNTVLCPTRVTKNSSSLIDVMIRNKTFYHTTTDVVELGYSDHFAHVMNKVVENPKVHPEKIIRRVFSKRNIETLKSHLKNELWEDIYLQTEVNRAYSPFLTKFLNYFYKIFPKKKIIKE